MSDKSEQRKNEILSVFVQNQQITLQEILLRLPTKHSMSTLKRYLAEFEEKGFIVKIGQNRGTKYILTKQAVFLKYINPHEYCLQEIEKRNGISYYNFDVWNTIPSSFFSTEETNVLDTCTENYIDKSKNASDLLKKKEMERFVIELSWKSSKIEGNTYSLLDTEFLLKEGIEAKGHSHKEAVMILNHKSAFKFIVENITMFNKIDRHIIEKVHSLLVQELGIHHGYRKGLVGISGSGYKPLGLTSQIQEAVDAMCYAINVSSNPYTKALYLLIGISYIQPFEDGNKRTARLMANAVLLTHKRAPLSYRNVDEVLYRESMLVFYEQLSVVPIKSIFDEQYKFSCDNYMNYL